MNAMVLQDLLILICENCSKNCDCFNVGHVLGWKVFIHRLILVSKH